MMRSVPEHYFQQSAALPFRETESGLQILVITSHKRHRWVIPKGVREPGMHAADSAAREALEEAGVEGDIDYRCLGRYRYRKWGGVCIVEVYPLAVDRILGRWPEDSRIREWVSPRTAVERVDEPELKRLIELFSSRF